jgi:hypothetical protein
MTLSSFSADDKLPLFLAEGHLEEDDVFFLEDIFEVGSERHIEGTISTPFREKSSIFIGDPEWSSLALLKQSGKDIPVDIELQPDYDFYKGDFACSFHAAKGCRFQSACFGVQLHTFLADPTASPQIPIEDAIVYDLFPYKLEDEHKINVKGSDNPQVNFNFNLVSGSVILPSIEKTDEYVSYTNHIETFGIRGIYGRWYFTRTQSHEIDGTQKLSMIVRKPKGTEVKMTFTLEAKVEFILGNVVSDPYSLIMLFRRRGSSTTLTDSPSIALK